MGRRALIAVLTLLQTLHIASWSAYYAITRKVYNLDESFIVMLAAAETLPTIVGLVGGFVAEKYGYRVVFLAGIAEGIFLSLTGVWLWDRRLLWISAFTASMLWSIAGPQILGYVLTLSGMSGRSLGIVLAGGALGWSIGGAAAPLLARITGYRLVLVWAGLAVAAVYAAALLLPPLKPSSRGVLGSRAFLLPLVMVPASLALAGTEVVGSIYLAKLSREFAPEMYALGIALSGVISAATRPYAGGLVDRFGPHRLLPLVLVAYSIYVPVLMYTHGILFLAAWLAPVYPFFDISLYRYAASLLGEALGSSAVSASYSVAGGLLMVLSLSGAGSTELNLFAMAAFLAAAAASIAIYKRYGEVKE